MDNEIRKKANEYIDLMYLINDKQSLDLIITDYNAHRDKCKELKLYDVHNNMINAVLNTLHRLKVISRDVFSEKMREHRKKLIDLEEKYSNLRTH